jgi:hypothetical protein
MAEDYLGGYARVEAQRRSKLAGEERTHEPS